MPMTLTTPPTADVHVYNSEATTLAEHVSSSIERVTEQRRLTPDQRRSQLLDVGGHEFATRAYEDVHMADVATRAGVSRGLVYRYFPAKRDLFAAIYQRASDRLLDSAKLTGDQPVTEQVLAGLDAHFDFFAANARTVLVANRGALAGDPGIQAIISDELGTIRQRMLDAIGLQDHQRELASAALAGWLSFVRTVCVEWLAHQSISRDELRDMCLRTLVTALSSVGWSVPVCGPYGSRNPAPTDA
jgi:AcrR family transcriptional regulator